MSYQSQFIKPQSYGNQDRKLFSSQSNPQGNQRGESYQNNRGQLFDNQNGLISSQIMNTNQSQQQSIQSKNDNSQMSQQNRNFGTDQRDNYESIPNQFQENFDESQLTIEDHELDQTDQDNKNMNVRQSNIIFKQSNIMDPIQKQQSYQVRQHQTEKQSFSETAQPQFHSEQVKSFSPGVQGHASQSQIQVDLNNAYAIQIIKFDEHSGQLELNNEAIQVLNQYEGNLSFVALAGEYRTGKSFLLNKLLNLSGDGFKVDSSVKACTQGIWMWSQPIYDQKENKYTFFLDTEGSNSTERNKTHDAKIFALAILMCNMFIFNSVGTIDERAIAQLQLTTTLSKNIAVTAENQLNGRGVNDNDLMLSQFTPKFVWLLRDFTLEFKRDQYGNQMTPQEYMENALNDESSSSKQTEQNRKIRQSLLSYFSDRDCMCLVRPVIEEDDLKILQRLPSHRLRKEFRQNVQDLYNKIQNNSGVKQLLGVNLNSRMYQAMCQSYVDVINNGGVPNISTAWEFILENECVQGYNDSVELYNQILRENFNQDVPKINDEMFQILKNARDQSLDKYQSVASIKDKNEYYNEYKSKLKAFMDQRESLAFKLNEDMSSAFCEKLLNTLSSDLQSNMRKGLYDVNQQQNFIDDYNQFLNDYEQQCIGFKKCEVLVNFLAGFQEEILKNFVSSSSKINQDAAMKSSLNKEMEQGYITNINVLNEKLQIYEERLKKYEGEKINMEKQKEKLQVQYDSAQRDNVSLNQQLGEKIQQAESVSKKIELLQNENKELNVKIKQLLAEKAKKKGCCS